MKVVRDEGEKIKVLHNHINIYHILPTEHRVDFRLLFLVLAVHGNVTARSVGLHKRVEPIEISSS